MREQLQPDFVYTTVSGHRLDRDEYLRSSLRASPSTTTLSGEWVYLAGQTGMEAG